MRHPRLIVFIGAFGALFVMSVLSAALGHVLPTLVPRRYTVLAAAGLFIVFGVKMLQEGIAMEGGTGKVEEEMREVEEELREKEDAGRPDLEAGLGGSPATPLTGRPRPTTPSGPRPLSQLPISSPRIESSPRMLTGSPAAKRSRSPPPSGAKVEGGGLATGFRNLMTLLVSPVLLQTFVMTFLAEWGDRSQISTIALAAAHVSSPS